MTLYSYPFVNPGYLEVFCGPVKSGKTRELINRIDKLSYLPECKFELFKPRIDTRDQTVQSRFGNLSYACSFVDELHPEEILRANNNKKDLVVIDECQFFALSLVDVVEMLLRDDVNVVVAGLELDFRGEPFGVMPSLISMANVVYKLSGVCDYDRCSAPATRTQRLSDGKPVPYDSPLIVIDDKKGSYECRCFKHHFVPGKPDRLF